MAISYETTPLIWSELSVMIKSRLHDADISLITEEEWQDTARDVSDLVEYIIYGNDKKKWPPNEQKAIDELKARIDAEYMEYTEKAKAAEAEGTSNYVFDMGQEKITYSLVKGYYQMADIARASWIVDYFAKKLLKLIEQRKSSIHPLKAKNPLKYIIPNNKLANEITRDLIGEGEVPLAVANKDSKGEVITTVLLDYDDEGILIYNKATRFTNYDRSVHNGVCSLFEAGNNVFTPAMVYRCMNGMNDNEKVSPQQAGAITKSLDKMSRIRCKIDWAAEVKSRGLIVDKLTLEGQILETRKITVSTGGKTVEAYKLQDKPILYFYSQQLKQVITAPSKLLNTKAVIRSTEDIIVIREYLLRRIEVMKHDKNKDKRIKYESIFFEIGLDSTIKDKAYENKSLKMRTAIKEILNYWIGEKYIKTFNEYKDGKTFRGIEIFY